MREYGYDKVSNKIKIEDRQLAVLRERRNLKEYIFVDKVSGKNFDQPEY